MNRNITNTTFLFKKEKDKVRCLACHQSCLIPEGKRGICGVRENRKGKLELLVYGKIIAKHLDPIEKKPLYHFLPGTEIYSLGTVGCNFHCGFCQNWSISQEREIIGSGMTPEKVAQEVRAGDYPSVAYTYNEPSIYFEYAFDIAKLLKERKHIFVSNGYFSDEALAKMNFVAAINIDLKSFREEFYQKQCGAKLKFVLENIRKAWEKKIWVEVTTLLIPGENDSAEEVRGMAKFLASVDKEIPWHLSAFHPDYKMLDKKSTTFQDLLKAYKIAKEEGLKYVYLGNVSSGEYTNTYCPQCQDLLIKREGYRVAVIGLLNGKCKKCGCGIKGVWE